MNSLWDILSVAIGVSFIFMILSILNSWLQEYISSVFNLRAKNLANVLQNMLEPEAKKLNGILKVFMPYIDSNGGVYLLSDLEDTAKKVLRRKSYEKYFSIDESLSIQEQPSMTSLKLGTVQKNEVIESTDELENDEGAWIKFLFKQKDGEKEAWLPKEKLKIVEKYQPTVEQVILRENPSFNSELLGTKNINDVIESMGEVENMEGVWIKFLFKKNEKEMEAWLNKEYLKKLEKAKLSERVDDIANSFFRTNTIEQWQRGAKDVVEKLKDNPVRFFYEHPVVYSLSKPGVLPDHLPTKDFTVALLDALDDAGRIGGGKTKTSDTITMENIKKGIYQLDNKLADRLRSLIYTAQINSKNGQADLESFQSAVAQWFDDTASRGKVWYKGNMQRVGIICGVLLAFALNADTIGIANALWHNAVLRESISQVADAAARQGQAPDTERAQAQLEELMALGLPIGWSFDGAPDNPRALPTTTGGWISKSIGLLLTGFAISQGSKIWFDLMNRLLNLRSSGLKTEEEESKPA